MLRQSSAHCEDVGVENDVLWLKAHLLHQDLVRPAADANLQGHFSALLNVRAAEK